LSFIIVYINLCSEINLYFWIW